MKISLYRLSKEQGHEAVEALSLEQLIEGLVTDVTEEYLQITPKDLEDPETREGLKGFTEFLTVGFTIAWKHGYSAAKDEYLRRVRETLVKALKTAGKPIPKELLP